jgi:hypothetical protein
MAKSPHGRLSRTVSSAQVDADGFGFSGLRIDAYFKVHDFALGDFITVSQGRDVKENVDATVIWFDEAKPLILVEHLNFTCWHRILGFSGAGLADSK